MKTIWVISLALILLPLAVLAINHIFVRIRLSKHARRKLERIQPLLNKLDSKAVILEVEILEMAKDPAYRQALYRALAAYSALYLFPAVYLTREKGAESFLVNWLSFQRNLVRLPMKSNYGK